MFKTHSDYWPTLHQIVLRNIWGNISLLRNCIFPWKILFCRKLMYEYISSLISLICKRETAETASSPAIRVQLSNAAFTRCDYGKWWGEKLGKPSTGFKFTTPSSNWACYRHVLDLQRKFKYLCIRSRHDGKYNHSQGNRNKFCCMLAILLCYTLRTQADLQEIWKVDLASFWS